MNNITIETIGNQLRVRAPYNSEFVEEARQVGGQWQDNAWVFDTLIEKRVREMCMENYGTDGHTTSTCVARVVLDGSEDTKRGPIAICGRPVARAFSRDSGAKVLEGVVVLEGGFTSGGSVANWYTCAKKGTTILIRDFPRITAENLIKGGADWISIEPEEAAAPQVDVDALCAERARLVARLAEIDSLLADNG